LGPSVKHDPMMLGPDGYPAAGSFCQAWPNDARTLIDSDCS
jgi:hypothetical protein